jgi:hypothetical protein
MDTLILNPGDRFLLPQGTHYIDSIFINTGGHLKFVGLQEDRQTEDQVVFDLVINKIAGPIVLDTAFSSIYKALVAESAQVLIHGLVLNPQVIDIPDPLNLVPPHLNDDFTLDQGTWEHDLFFYYQWNRNGVPIPGAINSTYTPRSPDDILKYLSVTVIAENQKSRVAVTTNEVQYQEYILLYHGITVDPHSETWILT